MKHTITEIVKNAANFSHYRDGNLYYRVILVTDKIDYVYTFPIDITNTEDIGNATFESVYPKALPLMRYIRKSIDNLTIVCEDITNGKFI